MGRPSAFTENQIRQMQLLKRAGLPISAIARQYYATTPQIRYYTDIVKAMPLHEVAEYLEGLDITYQHVLIDKAEAA